MSFLDIMSSRVIIMVENVGSSVDREEALKLELVRIRNTYSFKLGLLLTDCTFRKPWLLPLLPILFIKMNIDYLKSKNLRMKLGIKRKPFLPLDCLLLMPTSEEGMASIERCASIARAWKNEFGAEVIIASTNNAISDHAPDGCGVYLLPNPKELRGLSRSHWNISCSNLLISVIDTHRPFAFILDGPYPYRGVLNALEARSGVNAYWLRPKEIDNPDLVERGTAFESTIVMTFDGKGGVQAPTMKIHSSTDESKNNTDLSVLFALGYDKRKGKTKLRKVVLNHLGKIDDVKLVVPDHSSQEGFDGFDCEYWSSVANNTELPKLDCAITSSDPILVRQLIDAGVPTLCIAGDEADIARVLALREASHMGGLIVLHKPETLELNMAISTILDRKLRGSLGVHKNKLENPDDWGRLFSEIKR